MNTYALGACYVGFLMIACATWIWFEIMCIRVIHAEYERTTFGWG